jgi:hypothetical protein
MPDKKISALTSATTPLAGTEVLPIVQSGSTVKVPVADLTTGRAVTTGLLTSVPSALSGSSFFVDQYDTGTGGANVNVWVRTENYNNDGYGDGFYARYARGTATSPAAVQSGDELGYFGFSGYDGSGSPFRAWVEGTVDGAVSTDVVPTALRFITGASNISERMRITSAGNVGIGTTTPDAAALLDVASTTAGFLPPRMTGTQRDAISTPPNGLMIYNTTTDKLQVRAAGSWVDLH